MVIFQFAFCMFDWMDCLCKSSESWGFGIGESNERGRVKIPLFNGLLESPWFNGKSTCDFFLMS